LRSLSAILQGSLLGTFSSPSQFEYYCHALKYNSTSLLIALLWLHPWFRGSFQRRKYNLATSFVSSSLLCKSYCCKMLVLIEPRFFCKCRDANLHFEKSQALAEVQVDIAIKREQLRSFHWMSPNTCIKLCILSTVFWGWCGFICQFCNCGHLAAYTWLNASHLILQTWGRNWSEILIKLYLIRRTMLRHLWLHSNFSVGCCTWSWCNKFFILGFGCKREKILGLQGRVFYPVFSCGCSRTSTMQTRKSSDGDAVMFMTLMFLCCFHLFGMNELEWILLDTSWMWGKGAAKLWELMEFSLSSWWKTNKKANMWGDGYKFCFVGRIERRKERGRRLNFWVVIEVLRNPLCNVFQ
jgi:hypothetical protein